MKLVVVSHGVFSIHFNDEIIKLLLPDTSDEAHKMIQILSQFVEIQYPQAEKSYIASRKEKNKKRKAKATSDEKNELNLPRTLKFIFPVILVIVLSIVGTLAYSSVSD